MGGLLVPMLSNARTSLPCGSARNALESPSHLIQAEATLRARPRDGDLSVGLACRRDRDPDDAAGQEGRDALGPLHDHDAVALLEQLGEADGLEVVRAGHAIGVEVEDL